MQSPLLVRLHFSPSRIYGASPCFPHSPLQGFPRQVRFVRDVTQEFKVCKFALNRKTIVCQLLDTPWCQTCAYSFINANVFPEIILDFRMLVRCYFYQQKWVVADGGQDWIRSTYPFGRAISDLTEAKGLGAAGFSVSLSTTCSLPPTATVCLPQAQKSKRHLERRTWPEANRHPIQSPAFRKHCPTPTDAEHPEGPGSPTVRMPMPERQLHELQWRHSKANLEPGASPRQRAHVPRSWTAIALRAGVCCPISDGPEPDASMVRGLSHVTPLSITTKNQHQEVQIPSSLMSRDRYSTNTRQAR